MVRKKVYKKEQILKSAFEIFQKKGFSGLTARNVADHMGISTQPIYLEFQNMEDLKMTLLSQIYNQFLKEGLLIKKHSDAVLDFGLNFIDFAKKHATVFIALYTEPHGYGDEIKAHTFHYFYEHIKTDNHYQEFTKETCEQIHNILLVVASGIASMSISGIIKPSQEQVSQALEQTLQSMDRKKQ